MGIFIAWLSLSSSNSKNKLGTAYWGGSKEIKRAKKKALKQIAQPSRNEVCLWINIPKTKQKQQWQQWQHW